VAAAVPPSADPPLEPAPDELLDEPEEEPVEEPVAEPAPDEEPLEGAGPTGPEPGTRSTFSSAGDEQAPDTAGSERAARATSDSVLTEWQVT
jgi:hypothetical protein